VQWGQAQFGANQLPTGVVLGWGRIVYFENGANVRFAGEIPHALVSVTGRMRTLHRQLGDRDLRTRKLELSQFVEQYGTSPNERNSYYLADRMEILREPSGNELALLRGRSRDGIPLGLTECPSCGKYRGECLDSTSGYKGLVVRARCRCENDTRCVGCGAHFATDRLQSGAYNPSDRCVWHVPAFAALMHKCPGILA
jgi:hypothetical protein